MMTTTQPLDTPAPRRRFGWRWALTLTAGLAVAATVPLIVGAMGRESRGKQSPTSELYHASALVQLDRHAPRIIDDPSRRESDGEYALFRQTQARRMRTEPILWSALKRPEVQKLGIVNREEALEWVRENLEVQALSDSELVRITFRSEDPAEAATIANAVAEAYLAEYAEAHNLRLAARLTEMERYVNQHAEGLAGRRKAIERYERDLGENRKDPQLDELKQEVTFQEETRRWLVRELDRLKLESKARPRVQLVQQASVPLRRGADEGR